MRTNADDYKVFLEVYPGGGTRRNPKRKNAGSATAAPAEGPSPAEVDRVFEEHLQRMARGGTWGDNMEIQAFAREFDTNVQIYQRELAYVIQAPGGSGRPYAQIAYHVSPRVFIDYEPFLTFCTDLGALFVNTKHRRTP